MPGNDLSATTALIPVSSDTRATARANITTVLTNIINDIEPKVTPAGLDITTALSFLSGGTYQAATNVGYLNMQDRAADPSANESLYVKSDELYFLDGNGNAVAMTSSGSVAGASGNVTGAGYGIAGVFIDWDNGNDEYHFKKAAGASALADLRCDKVKFDDGGATFATLGAPASMAASLAFLLPGTFPASSGVVTLDSVGALGHTRALSVDSVTITGDYNHGSYTQWVSAIKGQGRSSSGAYVAPETTNENTWTSTGAVDIWTCPIELKVGKTVETIDLVWNPHASVGTKLLSVWEQDVGLGGGTEKGSLVSTTDATNGVVTSNVVTVSFVVGTTETYCFRFTGAALGSEIIAVKVVYSES